MRMMLNNAELEEYVGNIWERFIAVNGGDELMVSFEEPESGHGDGVWMWMEADGYTVLRTIDGYDDSFTTFDLDESIYDLLEPYVHEMAEEMDGNLVKNEISLASTVTPEYMRTAKARLIDGDGEDQD